MNRVARRFTNAKAPILGETRRFRRKQIPLCVPRPPKCGGKAKSRAVLAAEPAADGLQLFDVVADYFDYGGDGNG
jgi:hypothetical protein